MELQYIPRTFWHSLSLSVLIVSTGLTLIAYKSSTVSIELANAKINLSSEVSTSTQALGEALVEAKSAKLDAESKYLLLLGQADSLKAQLKKFGEQSGEAGADPTRIYDQFIADCPDCFKWKALPQALPFSTFDQNIEKAESSLKKLKALQNGIQPLQ